MSSNVQPEPRRRGRPPGRPRIYPDTADPTLDGEVRSGPPANEIIPKVWIICNFSIPTAECIAGKVLEKGDKAVLGCSASGKNGSETLHRAEKLRERWGGNCVVVQLDVR